MNNLDFYRKKYPDLIGKIPVYGYVRVSTKEQAIFGDSIPAQIDELKMFADENNLNLINIFVDDGKSALKRLDKREGLQEMLRKIPLEEPKFIIFTKLDRWSRNIRDYYNVQDVLDKYGVGWQTTQENFETLTSKGRYDVNAELNSAQRESEKRGERVKTVFEYKVKKGENIFSSTSLPIGLKVENKKVIIDKERVSIPLDFYEHYEIHRNKQRAIRYISEKYEEHFTVNHVKVWLKSSLMYGEYRNNKAYCEPIITKERFLKLKEIEKCGIKEVKNRYNYIFSGLIKCPYCGHRCSGKSCSSNGKKYPVYRCNRYNITHTCSNNKTISERKIERYLLNNINALISNYIREIEIKEKKEKSFEGKINNIKAKIKRLNDLYVNLIIDEDEFKSKYNDLNEELNKYTNIPKKENKQALMDFNKLNLIEIYNTLDEEEKGVLWRSIIKEITYDENKEPIIIFL